MEGAAVLNSSSPSRNVKPICSKSKSTRHSSSAEVTAFKNNKDKHKTRAIQTEEEHLIF